MIPQTERSHEIIKAVLQPDEIAIDATAGNGHDTLFLAKLVGERGHVYAFDIQSQAIHKTGELLDEHCLSHVTLLQRSHSEMDIALTEGVLGDVGAVMFNLGYLPHGDKLVTTQEQTTLVAVRKSLQMLRVGGVLSVLAYVGHPGGKTEADAVRELLSTEPGFEEFLLPQNELAPRLFVVIKNSRDRYDVD